MVALYLVCFFLDYLVCFFPLNCVNATASCGRMASFGMEDFAKKFGNLEPAQFVDIIALAGDKSDNIPG